MNFYWIIQVSPILLIFIVTPKDSLDPSASGPVNAPPPVVVEPERNDALEAERPGDAVFPGHHCAQVQQLPVVAR
jgi:hypothetical protein